MGPAHVGVRGRAVDRVNRGRLGPKDLFGRQANGSPDRLTTPLIRRDGHLVECAWDTAMERIVALSRELLADRGPGSLGFYTSGRLFLEEYDLARWSEEHALRVAQAARDQGLDLDDSTGTGSGALAELRRKAAEAVGHRPEPGLLLLRDLRALHLDATENSLYWEMLAQVAQATRNEALLTLASDCHPPTLRQIRWTNTMIKNVSPQILASL